jgi:hypothetical protein
VNPSVTSVMSVILHCRLYSFSRVCRASYAHVRFAQPMNFSLTALTGVRKKAHGLQCAITDLTDATDRAAPLLWVTP